MKRYKRIPGVLFPEKGGYTKAQYAYYTHLKKKVAERDDYACVSCGKIAPFKLKWGCSKQPNYQTDSPDAHCITCPFLPTLPQNELVEKAYVERGKETIRVFARKGCMSCPDNARTKIVSKTERELTEFCMHHLDGNPYNQSDSNVVFCCLSCNHKLENTKNGRKKEVDMLFSKKKQEADSSIVEEQKMATLELKAEPQIDQSILTRLQFLEEQNTKNGKELNQCKQKIHTLETWVHLTNGGNNTHQITSVTETNHRGNMRNKDTIWIDENRNFDVKNWDRKTYRDIKQALKGKGLVPKIDGNKLIGGILDAHKIGRSYTDAYVLFCIRQKIMIRENQKTYKILI